MVFWAACPLIDMQPILSGTFKVYEPETQMKTEYKTIHANICQEIDTEVQLPRIGLDSGWQSVNFSFFASPGALLQTCLARAAWDFL